MCTTQPVWALFLFLQCSSKSFPCLISRQATKNCFVHPSATLARRWYMHDETVLLVIFLSARIGSRKQQAWSARSSKYPRSAEGIRTYRTYVHSHLAWESAIEHMNFSTLSSLDARFVRGRSTWLSAAQDETETLRQESDGIDQRLHHARH